MDTPILSIYIPTYNRALILHRLLSTLYGYFDLNEEFKKLVQIVVSDNASSDKSKDVCDIFLNLDSSHNFFKYHRNDENIGALNNFVQAPEICNSKYIWIMGDDDLILLHYIPKVLEYLKVNTTNIILLNSITDSSLGEDDFYEMNVNTLFSKYPLASLGHISRLILNNDFFSMQKSKLDNRPSYYIWPMILPFLSIANTENITVGNIPIIYPTKDGGMDIWRHKIALPRLAEFVNYCQFIAKSETELRELFQLNFPNRKKIARDYLAASITNPQEKEAFKNIDELINKNNMRYNFLILLGKFFQTRIGKIWGAFIYRNLLT